MGRGECVTQTHLPRAGTNLDYLLHQSVIKRCSTYIPVGQSDGSDFSIKISSSLVSQVDNKNSCHKSLPYQLDAYTHHFRHNLSFLFVPVISHKYYNINYSATLKVPQRSKQSTVVDVEIISKSGLVCPAQEGMGIELSREGPSIRIPLLQKEKEKQKRYSSQRIHKSQH